MKRILMTADWVVGHQDGAHCMYRNGVVVVEGDKVLHVGYQFDGDVAETVEFGAALIGPGFVDLDALGDLDTTVLGYDNQPPERKGRVWPQSYIDAGPREMYSPDELAFQKRYAFSRLIRNGITTALPIASLFYRAWGETYEEFAQAAQAAEELGLRVYLGPAYRTGNLVVDDVSGDISFHYDEEKGLAGLAQAERFAEQFEGRAKGLIRTMLAPDRIETCTPELLLRTGELGRALDIPVRLHCCQSRMEYDKVLAQHGKSPLELLRDVHFFNDKTVLPHGLFLSGLNGIAYDAPDTSILVNSGAALAHCPLVMARGGRIMKSFRKFRDLGVGIGLGTDTHPPDMIANMALGVMTARIAEENPGAATAADLYSAATVGGADALGRSDLGRLQPGSAADLNVIRLDDPAMGQLIDPIQTILLNGCGRDVSDVMIAGVFVMRNREINGVDNASAQKKAQAQFEGMMAKYPERTLGHPDTSEIFSSSFPAGPVRQNLVEEGRRRT
ncbi:chlorohydrolase family protein [Parasedimentitalea psychrophila]|uniref:Chlorohydrolase family protein n=1 Tax=Parasedimentitalea psychrophila TaxID=2997337 RepID=A0A9Y2P799_9RHOB|nr:chlorohydrolase family protein [Parasedimentitalea psychrophila]WIY25818.1 chlorohydrolase family protein [Parasedimentitalea psychrophila]